MLKISHFAKIDQLYDIVLFCVHREEKYICIKFVPRSTGVVQIWTCKYTEYIFLDLLL